MTITESLKYEFYVIMGILFFGAIFGLEESQNYWRWDIGRCIFAIGALWLVGSMFRFYPSLIHNYASIIAAISVFLLGFSIHEYGIFTEYNKDILD